MSRIDHRRIAILATDGYEKSELFEPKRQLAEAGATVTIIAPDTGEIRSWDENDWGEAVSVDMTIENANPDDFDALVLPGGQINPDVLRVNKAAVAMIKKFHDAGKPIAAICHAPWLLIEAGLIDGREATSYHSIRTDMENAGANWRDREVVTDSNLITSRQPGDLDAFCNKLIEMLASGADARAA
ncbi:MAG: type 1 glutamine amidotransferase domain-containing protein [Pseudomonadota bacterium]